MAIKSVGQENTAFFVDESIDPTTYGGQFLSYNPQTNSYEYVGYQEYIERTGAAVEEGPKTIKDFFDTASGTTSGGTPGTFSPVEGTGLPGTIHHAATGFSAFNTVVDVLTAPTDALGLGMTVYEGYQDFQTGMTRAETFAQAAAPTATVADKLAASQQEPSWVDYAKDLAMGAVSVLTASPKGMLGAALGLGSTISADIEADRALTEAGQLERLGYASGFTPAQVSGFSGYQQTIADFMANQQANLAAAQVTEEETQLASITPHRDVLTATVGQALTGTAARGGVTSASASAAYDVFGGRGSTATEQREAYAEATKGTSEQDFGFGGDGGDDRDTGGYGGFGGGTGAGGFEGDIGGGGFGGYA